VTEKVLGFLKDVAADYDLDVMSVKGLPENAVIVNDFDSGQFYLVAVYQMVGEIDEIPGLPEDIKIKYRVRE
jgi:hypothetical protein